MNKKTVLYVSPNGYLGGAEKVVITLAQAHLEKENFFPVIMFFSEGEAVSAAKKIGIKTIVIKKSFRLSRINQLIPALKEIRETINTLNPYIIHNTMAYSHLVISVACIGKKFNNVWFQHGPVGKQLDKLASFFPVDYLFFNSKFLKQKHHESFPQVLIRKSEHIIPMGVAVNSIDRVTPIFSGKEITFGIAGRICTGKAFDLILNALGELKAEGKLLDFKLLIAGNPKGPGDDAYLKLLKKLTVQLRLENQVTFLGHVDDMGSFYRSIDLFIHATLEPEPFGLVIAEAMSSQCLVLASDAGGAGELIDYGKNGFSYNCTDLIMAKENLKKEIVFILDQNTDQLRLCAQSGQKFINEHYNTASMISAVEKIYNA